jgi:hypothetical protein
LRGKALATLWRLRLYLGSTVGLWLFGLFAGAIHPWGFVLSAATFASWMWLMTIWGIISEVKSNANTAQPGSNMLMSYFLIASAALPYLLPMGVRSVIAGAGSLPFVLWQTQFSYRDLRNALHYTSYPHFHWIGIQTGEGLLSLIATCALGVALPLLCGLYAWQYAIAYFDRHAGRPWRLAAESAAVQPWRPTQEQLA